MLAPILVLGSSACVTHARQARQARQAHRAAPASVASTERPRLRVENGTFVGVREDGARVFRGVPYAAPPVGALRFAPPAPPPRALAEREASKIAAPCPQRGSREDEVVGVEDCLTADVYLPERPRSERLPILVFVHGGGHVAGTTADPEWPLGDRVTDGARFAGAGDAIVVAVNYRLGPLGYLAHDALAAPDGANGNWGTLDQIAALAWVQRNAAALGGDAARVTAWGHSAGAAAVAELVASPRARGLFARAIVESGRAVAKPKEQALTEGRAIAARLCPSAARDIDVARCLRALPFERVLAVVGRPPPLVRTAPNDFDATIDGVVLDAPPLVTIAAGRGAHVPLLLGTTTEETGWLPDGVTLRDADELARARRVYAAATCDPAAAGAALALYASPPRTPRAAYVEATTDAKFACATRALAIAAAPHAPVFLYRFARVPGRAPASWRERGAFHASDLRWVFGHLVFADADDEALADRMHRMWVAFAAAGNPSVDGTTWPAPPAALRLDAAPTVELEYPGPYCGAWSRVSASCAGAAGPGE